MATVVPWTDPQGRNISLNDFNALVLAMGKGQHYTDGFGFELVTAQVQAWAPAEQGPGPDAPGFLEGYYPLKLVQQFIPDPTVPIAIMARWDGFGAGQMPLFAFASDVKTAFTLAAEQGDLAVGNWYATLATPRFSVMNWMMTLYNWRAQNS